MLSVVKLPVLSPAVAGARVLGHNGMKPFHDRAGRVANCQLPTANCQLPTANCQLKMPPLRIATRKSPLALWQANWVAAQLTAAGHRCELVPLVSAGDNDLRPITSATEVGLFTKRIQQALLDDEADVAVHSLKDLPTATIDGLGLAAISQRAAVEDRLVTPTGCTLDDLPLGAVVGTSSRRRAAQLLAYRPDLVIRPIRGNVQTRLDQVARGDFAATVLAAAGLERLEMHDVAWTTISLEVMLPAPGQAALAIETRSADDRAIAAVQPLDHAATRSAVTAERALLRTLLGGCLAPIAALGSVSNGQLELQSVVLSVDGQTRLSDRRCHDHTPGDSAAAERLGQAAAEQLLRDGAGELIQEAR